MSSRSRPSRRSSARSTCPGRRSGSSARRWSSTTTVGEPAVLRGTVRDESGAADPGRRPSTCGRTPPPGFYAVQQPDVQPPTNLRGVYRTDEQGRYEIRTVGRCPTRFPTTARSGGCWSTPAVTLAGGAHPRQGLGRRLRTGDDPPIRPRERLPGLRHRVRRQGVADQGLRPRPRTGPACVSTTSCSEEDARSAPVPPGRCRPAR